MEEVFDVCTIDRKSLNKTCSRGTVLGYDEYHVVVMAILINQNGKVLLTKRSINKSAAGKWECTAGSVIAGENSKDAIIREVKEEIGIKINIDLEKPIAHYIENDAIFDIWTASINNKIDELVLQYEEVDEAKYCTLTEIIEIINSDTATKSLNEVIKLAKYGLIKVGE